MNAIPGIMAAGLLVCASALPIACVNVQAHGHVPGVTETAPNWIADRADIICGLDDPRVLSNPAKVDYPSLLRATPEMKKMREDRIDPQSPEGIQLAASAVDRVRTAAETARVRAQHCSVWKRITHRDGRIVPDLTDKVLALM